MATTTKRKKASKPKRAAPPSPDVGQKALVQSLRGSLSAMTLTVDDYLREKYAETATENGF
jgi:hypothetical protein